MVECLTVECHHHCALAFNIINRMGIKKHENECQTRRALNTDRTSYIFSLDDSSEIPQEVEDGLIDYAEKSIEFKCVCVFTRLNT